MGAGSRISPHETDLSFSEKVLHARAFAQAPAGTVTMVDIRARLPMPIFLFVSTVANIAFLVRACKDVCAKNRRIRPPGGPAVALLTCAISELIWCLLPPCLAL